MICCNRFVDISNAVRRQVLIMNYHQLTREINKWVSVATV